MGKSKIFENDPLYNLLRPYVDLCIKRCYRKIEVIGEENIPTDGAVILTPNHCNTLMDALVVLRAHKGPTVFGARADMFNNPIIAKIMFFLRILPMVRQRDGLRNVLKNHQTQETIVETLENGVRFCIYPEGRHRAAKSLLPLGKGVFRAAIAANARFGEEKPVYIVPVGLDYGDFFRFRSTSLLTYGPAINVTEFVRSLDTDNESAMIEPLRKELAGRISGLFSYIKDDEQLQNKWVLTKMLAIAGQKKGYGDFRTSLSEGTLRNREIISIIEGKCLSAPEKMEKLLQEVSEFERKRRKKGISIYSFRKRKPVTDAMAKGLAALLGLPYFIYSAAVASPMWVASAIIRSKVKDRAFRNTVNLGVRLVLGALMIPVWAALAFCLAPWWIALPALLLALPSYNYFHDYIEGCRRWFSDLRLMGEKKLLKSFDHIVKTYRNID